MDGNPYREPAALTDVSSIWNRPGKPVETALVTIAIAAVVVSFLLPMRRMSRGASQRTQCLKNMHNICMAFAQYHGDYDVFPPAYTVDADGRPLHSWRTLLLPYLDQQALYDSIDFSKPWDDPANRTAFDIPLSVFASPSADLPHCYTTYLANTSENGVLHPGQSLSVSEITDGTMDTLMIVEVPSAVAVHWMAPVDDDGRFFLNLNPESKVAHPGVTVNAMVDGSVHTLPLNLSVSERRALMTAAGGEEVSW